MISETKIIPLGEHRAHLDTKLAYPTRDSYMGRCKHTLPWGEEREVLVVDQTIIVTNYLDSYPGWLWHDKLGREFNKIPAGEDFLKSEVTGPATTKTKARMVYANEQDSWSYNRKMVERQFLETYPLGKKPQPFLFVPVRITEPKSGVFLDTEIQVKLPVRGVISLGNKDGDVKITTNFLGVDYTWEDSVWDHKQDPENRSDYARTVSGFYRFYYHCENSIFTGGLSRTELLALHIKDPANTTQCGTKGVANVLKKKDIAPNIERLEKEEPALWAIWLWMLGDSFSGRVSNNQLLATFLEDSGRDYKKLLKGLKAAIESDWTKKTCRTESSTYSTPQSRKLLEQLPGVQAFLDKKLEQFTVALEKSNEKVAESLGVDPIKYPKLNAALTKGQISRMVFQQPVTLAPVNREYAIWEKALARKGWSDTIFDICANVSGRSTYERDFTSYLSFLFKIEKYLDRHTEGRKKWTAQPKFVQSQFELEMDEETEGTSKRRSALTPEADNETRTITVPYAAMSISGFNTTYCYSRHYSVFEEGMMDPESEGIVVQDLEPKLNGRDDYGLMFYTLTGSYTNRGYPTFLIIFERRTVGTFVHFHRVHPCRKKSGIQTPACDLVEACYQYMAGNVPAADVAAQQGDLIFLRTAQVGTAVLEPYSVAEFESHRFVAEGGVQLFESTAKSPRNRLGYLKVSAPLSVRHPEHEDLEGLAEGIYEIRRCKSYENNPVAQWTRTID